MTGALTNHLWQSTVFAIAAGLVALALRKNRAETRYWLWLSASLKFLLPFSLLVSLGSHFEWAPAAQKITAQAVSFTVVQLTEPFPDTISVAPSIPHATDGLLISLLGIWLCGFLVIVVQLFRGWLYIRAAVRSSTSLKTGMAVEVRTCPGLLEPGVVGLDVAGLSRPIVLLPAGILECLTQSQLEAVLAHELSHVRRRDNLTAALHMIVEAAFWFHPFVWWIGARLVEERERACDEEVMRLGNEPKVYAESILRVCEFYVESPLACVSGVTGSDLKKRIQRIMKNHFGVALTAQKKLLLVTVGVFALAIPIVAGVLTAPLPGAQVLAPPSPSTAQPSFEVVSIKRHQPGDERSYVGMHPGRFTGTGATAKLLIEFAYDVQDFQLSGAPGWTTAEKYDIDAKEDESVAKELERLTQFQRMQRIQLMVQSLLADRFKLTVSHSTKESAIYALVIAKDGPKFKPAVVAEGQPQAPPRAGITGLGKITATNVPIGVFAQLLSHQLGREVIDKTGLTGVYNMDLQFRPDEGQQFGGPDGNSANAPSVEPSGPSIFTAIQEQLGLRLESQKGPVDTIAVDYIEEPSPN